MDFKSYKLSQLVNRKKITAKIESDKLYKRVTIKLYHKGIIQRDEEIGKNIKSNMFFVSEGDFILSGIDARNGAFGIVPKELDGAVITNDFWCLEPKDELLNKEFFLFLTSTSFFDYICKVCSDGTTQRIRLQKDRFFDFEISIPSIENQHVLVRKLKSVNYGGINISSEIRDQLDLIKDLRQAFLREAIQGLLVSNDTSDGKTGRDLLAEIQAEKARMVKEKKIKKPKPLAPITEAEIPYEIPDNWTWCRLGEIAFITSGSTPSSDSFVEKGIPYFKMYNIRNQEIDFWHRPQFIKEEVHNGKLRRCRLFTGDVLMNIVGPPLGKLAIVPDTFPQANFNQAAVLIRPFFLKPVNRFVYWYLNEMSAINAIETKGVAGQANISVTQSNNIKIPLPPLEIQERIVSKLDELMGYCNALEQQVKESQKTNELLLQQVLREALEGKSNEDNVVEEVEDYQAMVAEVFGTTDKVHSINDADLEIAAMVYLMKSGLGLNYGEVALQKTVYNTSYITPNMYSKKHQFKNYHYGTYSEELKGDIQNNPYLMIQQLKGGKEVYAINPTKEKEILDVVSKKENKSFVMAINNLLQIYSLPFINKETDKIELFNTVLKVYADLRTTNVDFVYQAMKDWKIKQTGFKSKAEKFSKEDTEKMIELLLNRGVIK